MKLDQAFVSTLVGGVLALAGSILGGLGGSYVLARNEERRRRSEHKSAVLAVLYEMRANLGSIEAALRQGSTESLVFSRETFSNMQSPLFAFLPDEVASKVTMAYGRYLLIQPTPTERASFQHMQASQQLCLDAYTRISDYAGTLGIESIERQTSTSHS